MDRLIATNSVNLAGADGPPVGGTPQYGTDGNPALNIPPTRWPAYQYNAMQEEIIAVIVGAGLAPDRNNTAQLYAAILAMSTKTQPVYGEISGAGAGNITYNAALAQSAVIDFTAGGGGGGTGDGGAGGSSGTYADGATGAATVVNGVTASPGLGGPGGRVAGNTVGGDGGSGGAGTGFSYHGQPGNCGLWTPASALGNIGGNGGKSQFGSGGQSGNNQSGTKGGGGAGGKTGNSGTFSGAGGGAGETRRIVLNRAALVTLAGNIAYSIGAGGGGGVLVGNFNGGNGGDGFVRYQFNF